MRPSTLRLRLRLVPLAAALAASLGALLLAPADVPGLRALGPAPALAQEPAERPLPAGAIARLVTPTADSTANLRPTIVFSPDGRTAAVVTGSAGSRTAALYETAKWTRTLELGATGRFVAFSPDGKHLAVPRVDAVALVDPLTGEAHGAPIALPVGLPGGRYKNVKPIADGACFTPDARSVLLLGHFPAKPSAAPDDALVYAAVDVASRRTAYTMESKPTPLGDIWEGHGGAPTGAVFSPDGKTFATSAEDRHLCLWEFATWKLNRTFDLDCEPPPLGPFIYSRDGSRLVIGDRRGLRLWDNRTGRPGPACPMPAEVRSLALSPDGDTLACGLADGKIALVSLKALKALRGVGGLGAGVVSLAYSPDGKSFAAGTSDGGVVVWKAK